jgi:hypothetical protein
MESETLDAVARSLGGRRSRRAATGLLGGLLALPLLGATKADAKRKKRKKRKGGGKKGGGGNGGGACVPNCGGAKCDVSDGCGGTCVCAAGSICAFGTCQTCDVIHNGNDVTSGEALRQKMAIPLDDDSYLYVCPGRYVGSFTHAGGNLVGAGDGTNPATSTILDLAGGTVPGTTKAVFMVGAGAVSRVYSVRITGSTESLTHGVHVPSNAHLTMNYSTVTGNKGPGITGLYAVGTFELLECTISENGSTDDLPYTYHGGGIRAGNAAVSDIIDCRISDNIAGGNGGGGVYVVRGPLNIFNSEISGNKVLNSLAQGGGIYQEGGAITLRADTSITGNRAGNTGGGGGIYRAGGTINWEGPTVENNSPNNCVDVPGCTG